MPPKVKLLKTKAAQKKKIVKKTITKISGNTKIKQLPQHSIIIKRVEKMNPNRVRERSFILSKDMKSILYIRTHFNDQVSVRKIFHTVDIFKKQVSNVDETDIYADRNLISFVYENNGGFEKNEKDKKRVIEEAKAVAEAFFTGYKTIEIDDAIALIEEKIARNMLQPQTKAVRTRRKELRRGLQFINAIVEKKKKERQQKIGNILLIILTAMFCLAVFLLLKKRQ